MKNYSIGASCPSNERLAVYTAQTRNMSNAQDVTAT